LIGQFCVFEWARSNNRSFESTDSTNGFRGSNMRPSHHFRQRRAVPGRRAPPNLVRRY
jgi:hypothetical protein